MSKIDQNTVSSKNQVQEYDLVRTVRNGGNLKVLFLGNSITRHAPAPHIGWDYDWGMSASAEERDYVHVAAKLLEERLGGIDFCTACCADWERNHSELGRLDTWRAAREFEADIVVCRLGENVITTAANTEWCNFAKHLDAFIKYFCSNPNVKVIVTDLFWPKIILDTPIRQVALDNNYELVGLNDLGTKDENMAVDGRFWHHGVSIHPNDLGMQRIAEQIVEKIFQIL